MRHLVSISALMAIAVLFTLGVHVVTVVAQSISGQYAVTHSVVAPGATLKGGSFGLNGTVGEASVSSSGSGAYRMTSGYAAAAMPDRIFTNGFDP